MSRLSLLIALFCIFSMQALSATEVNVYSARKEALIKPLLDQFSQQTDISVNLVTGKADALLARLRSEGSRSPADVLITVDAGRLHRAKSADLLQIVESGVLQNAIPAQYRDVDNMWFGLSIRARPIMYAKDRVQPTELSTYEDLVDVKWRNRICVRSSNNIYNQSLVASMIAAIGVEKTEVWARGLVANMARPPQGGDRDQITAAASGECDIAIANTYYLARMLSNQDDIAQQQIAEKIGVFWPNQQDRGTHVNVSGIGVTHSAPNPDNAIKLIEFLVSQSAQNYYAQSNHEYPVVEEVPWGGPVIQWGEFKMDAINLSILGENNSAAVKLMDRAGWR